MKKVFALCLFMILCSSSVRAEYLFFKRASQGSKSTCLESIGDDDPEWSSLYSILETYQWPMSLAHADVVSGLSEEEAIKNELKQKKLDYEVFWVPSTFFELFSAQHIISHQRGFLWDPSIRGRLPIRHLMEDKRLNDLEETFLDAILEHFKEVNHNAIHLHGKVNHAFGKDILSSFTHHGDCLSEDFQSQILDLDFINQKRIEYLNQWASNEDILGSRVYNTLEYEYSKNLDISESIIIACIREEIGAYFEKSNSVFLYRGTNGVLVDSRAENSRFLDSSLELDGASAEQKSLSFGVSLLAGLLFDRGGSCVYHCFRSYLGYLLKVNKSELLRFNSDLSHLFYVPAYGPIPRVLGSGEYFHARTTIGVKDISDKDQSIPGIKNENYPLRQHEKFRFLVLPEMTQLEAGTKISKYISEYAIPFSYYRLPIDEGRVDDLIKNQRKRARYEQKALKDFRGPGKSTKPI